MVAGLDGLLVVTGVGGEPLPEQTDNGWQEGDPLEQPENPEEPWQTDWTPEGGPPA